MYKKGSSREDALCLKFNMESHPVDLRLGDDEYMSDLWFWKANRTNPASVADDKTHQLSAEKLPKSSKITSKSGKKMYLIRKRDAGSSSYKGTALAEYQGDQVPNYITRPPSGSRGDVKAKGIWADGKWTIELSRALNTGNDDDVVFDPAQTLLFGVARYEIAGKKANPKIDQPLFNSGEITELLTLEFK